MEQQSFFDILQDNTIYQIITGSTSYGLATESSDIDQKALVILPPKYTLHLDKPWETTTYHEPDIEFHSLKKAINLLCSQNPTMLETLFVDDEFIVKQTDYGKALQEHKQLFLSKNCYYAFGGYAKDQLMRIKNGLHKATKQDHNHHLSYTINRMRKELINKYPSIPNDKLQINQVYFDRNDTQNVDIHLRLDSVPLTELNSVISELNNALKGYNKVNNRNKKPTGKLFKHAMHLVRLLLMGIEVLETGQLSVYRKKEDREFLMAIRNESYSWDELFEIADQLFAELEQAKHKSVLPEKVNREKVNQLYFDLISSHYGLP